MKKLAKAQRTGVLRDSSVNTVGRSVRMLVLPREPEPAPKKVATPGTGAANGKKRSRMEENDMDELEDEIIDSDDEDSDKNSDDGDSETEKGRAPRSKGAAKRIKAHVVILTTM